MIIFLIFPGAAIGWFVPMNDALGFKPMKRYEDNRRPNPNEAIFAREEEEQRRQR